MPATAYLENDVAKKKTPAEESGGGESPAEGHRRGRPSRAAAEAAGSPHLRKKKLGTFTISLRYGKMLNFILEHRGQFAYEYVDKHLGPQIERDFEQVYAEVGKLMDHPTDDE